MKVTRNDDKTVTVRIPKAPEVYEPADGQLYIEEALSGDDFRAALKPPKAPKPEPEA